MPLVAPNMENKQTNGINATHVREEGGSCTVELAGILLVISV